MNWSRLALVVSLLLFALAAPVGVAAGADQIVETVRIHPTPDTQGSFEVTYRYEFPSRVSKLEVTLPALAGPSTVVGTTRFERQDETTFVWEGGSDAPSVTVRVPADRGRMDEYSSVETPDSGFYVTPETGVRWWYGHSGSPSFDARTTIDGPGYAASGIGYAGGHTRHRRSVDGVDITVVVADGAAPADSGDRIAQLLRNATRDFSTGNQYDQATAFVLPAERTSQGFTGRSFGTAFWVDDSATDTRSVDSTVTHEYIHSRVGGFPNGTSAWLTEAFAEYYGAYLVLNDGSASFDSFHEYVTTTEYDPAAGGRGVVLAQQSSWASTDADYDKGANVLAALDAKIRNETNGNKTLQHVLALRFEENSYDGLRTYEDFRAAVVDVSGSQSLGPWLDKYVRTEAVPPVPANPHVYTAGPDLDPDDDDLPNRLERTTGTHPFDPDTDDDGLTDGFEHRVGLAPLDPDADDDGLTDSREREERLDPTDPDWDDDGLADGEETDLGTDPKNSDTDGDGTPDGEDEYPLGGTPTATPAKATTPNAGGDSTPTAPPSPGGTGPGFSALAALAAVLAAAVPLSRS